MYDTFELALPRDLTSAGRARDETSKLLEANFPRELVDDVLIVVSELVTNAVQHTGHGCLLVVRVADDEITVEVRDANSSPNSPRQEGPGELGRGLGVVQSLTRKWGIDRLADGKCVWAEVALPAASNGHLDGDHDRTDIRAT